MKDLAAVHAQHKHYDEAIATLEKHINEFSEKSAPYNLLISICLAAGKYDTALTHLPAAERHSKIDKLPYIYRSYAQCYIRKEKYDLAKEKLNQVLNIKGEDLGAINMLDALLEAEEKNYSNINELMDNLVLDELTELSSSEINPLIRNALKANHYEGLPASVKAKGEKYYDKSTLKQHQEYLKKAGFARPEERASYLLTEAKLVKLVERGSNEAFYKSLLARYCNAKAQICFQKNYANEIARYYYSIAFEMEEEWERLHRQVAIYILSSVLNPSQLMARMSGKVEFDHILRKEVKTVHDSELFWRIMLTMFASSRVISAKLIDQIFKIRSLKSNALQFLYKLTNVKLDSNCTKSEFIKLWNKARSIRIVNLESLISPFKSMVRDVKSLSELPLRLIESNRQITENEWLLGTDTHRLNGVVEIANFIDQYLSAPSYEDRKKNSESLGNRVRDLIDDICEKPTRFSVEALLPFLEFLNQLAENHFNNIKKTSKPKFNIKVLTDAAITAKVVKVKLEIYNQPECSPINELTLIPEGNSNCKPLAGEMKHFELLRGGKKIYKEMEVEVSPEAIAEKTATMDLKCHYLYNDSQDSETLIRNLTLRFYPVEEFKEIPNPHYKIANSGPVENEEMFFGRRELIEKMKQSILNSKSKSIAIYGQKRSGKSSVLYHLKRTLEKEKGVITSYFSMGEIVNNLKEHVIYYKIIGGIGDLIYDLESNGELVPDFQEPSFEALEKNPTITFDRFLKNFKRSCATIPGWENYKLVVLIDEFAYLYNAILRKEVSENFMKTWKAIIEKGSFNAILAGQDIMHKFIDAHPNEFGVLETMKLSYLDDYYAKELIEKPTWNNETNKSRYLEGAVEEIIEWTAGNPFYLQIFCSQLIDYLNKEKLISASPNDVEIVGSELARGKNKLEEKHFDNLLRGGDADLEEFDIEYTKLILKQIARNDKKKSYCERKDILVESIEQDNKILKALIDREVITIQNDYYKLRVKLLGEWLLS